MSTDGEPPLTTEKDPDPPESCKECNGKGVKDTVECGACRGTGVNWLPPAKERKGQ